MPRKYHIIDPSPYLFNSYTYCGQYVDFRLLVDKAPSPEHHCKTCKRAHEKHQRARG